MSNENKPTPHSVDIDSKESADRFLAAVGMAQDADESGWTAVKKPGRRGKPRTMLETAPGVWAPRRNPHNLQLNGVEDSMNSLRAPAPTWRVEHPRQDSSAPGRVSHNTPRPPLPAMGQNQSPMHQNPTQMRPVPPITRQGHLQHIITTQNLSAALRRDHATKTRQPTGSRNVKPPSQTGADIVSVKRSISLPSVNLMLQRPPGRRRDSKTSASPSLPSITGDWEAGEDADEVTSVKPDIRNSIGLRINDNRDGTTWHRFSWTLDKGTDEMFSEDDFFKPFICKWIEGCFSGITANFQGEQAAEHWKCDIDPCTGHFFPPVDYPETFPQMRSRMRAGLDWRQQTWTSTLLMRRRADLKANTGPGGIIRGGEPAKKGQDWPEFPPDLDDPEIRKAQRLEMERRLAALPKYNINSPRLPCYLRPADIADMEEVTAIYNEEVEKGLQAPDSEPLSLEDYIGIYEETQNLGVPFLVAVYGQARQLKVPKDHVSFSKVVPHPDSTAPPNLGLVGKVLGFAYLSVWHPGLAGSGNGSSRASARVNLYVLREYRQKRIGFSLLDKLLSCVSTRFESNASYDYLDGTSSQVYKGPRENKRKFWRIYLNFNIKSKRWAGDNPKLAAEQAHYEDEHKAHHKILDEMFNFEVQGRFQECYRTPRCRPGPVLWLDSVIYQHDCHNGLEIPGDANY